MNAILFAAALVADPFVPSAELPAWERLPRQAALSVADDGTFRVNGSPRYLTATLFYGGAEDETKRPTSGYPAALKWLYEDLPGYEGMQRLGLDAVGFEAGRAWMGSISPQAGRAWQASPGLPASPRFNAILAGQLPAYVDFTPAPWGHGGLGPKLAPDLPREAWTDGENHWVPYSIHHPEGRRIWLTMWETEVRRCRTLPVPPWCYELMNEPSVLDRGAYARGRFRASGRRDHPVEFMKFTEDAYLDLIAEGARRIHDLQPGARVTVQPVNARARGIDLYRLSRTLDVVCTPTGGGGLVGAHLMRACADGKPIVDGETYVGGSRRSVRNALVTQFARGINASYTFKWSRRPRDWARGGDAAQEAPLARKVPAYNYLNPYVVPGEALLGFRLARRETLAFADLFVPRDRGTPRRVAVLYSKPTERLCAVNPNLNTSREFDKALTELDYAHLNPDVIFEEQLVDDPKRLDRYAMLVAAGVSAAYPTTPAAIRAWQGRGGRLVIVGEGLDADECGKPNGASYPDAWRVASAGVSAVELGRRLADLAARAGIRPTCTLGDAVQVEVVDAARGGLRGWILVSHALTPQLAAFRPADPVETLCSFEETVGADGRVVSERRERLAAADGTYPLWLEPGCPVLLAGGPRAAVLGRWPARDDARWLAPLKADAAQADAERRLAQWRRARLSRADGYHPDVARTHAVDLARAANARRLEASDWGLRTVEGVPFEFIRTDQNFFRDVVRLESGKPSVTVPVDESVLHLYADYSGLPRFTAAYADGSRVTFAASPGEGTARRVWRWTNPKPDVRLTALELASDRSESVVAALTVETPVAGTRFLTDADVRSVRGASGASLTPTYAQGELRLLHGERPSSWSCAALKLARPVALPRASELRLAMEVNALPNRFGAPARAPTLQVRCALRLPDGAKAAPTGYLQLVTDNGATAFRSRGTDSDSNSWETVWATFAPPDGVDGVTLTEIGFQYQALPGADPGALAVRNLRLEPVGAVRESLPTGCPDFEIDLPRRTSGGTVRAADYGFSATNACNGAAIARAVAAARRLGAARVVLAPGRYFCRDRESILVEGMTDFTFDGAGAELVFCRPAVTNASAASFLIRNCTRVAFGNLAVDWDWQSMPLASFAKVVDCHLDARDNESYVDFAFTDCVRHPYFGRTPPVQTVMAVSRTLDGFSTDYGPAFFGQALGHSGARSEWLSPNRLRLWPYVRPTAPDAVVVSSCLRHYSARSNRSKAKDLARAKGTDQVFRLAHCYYGHGAFEMDTCAHLTMKDIRIYSTFGMGFVTRGKQHHWQLVNIRVAPPDGVKRPITTTADVNHVTDSRGWAKFVNVSVAMNQDDLSNFHDCTSSAKRIAPNTLAFTHARGNAYFKARRGDTVELREYNYEPTGIRAKVVSASQLKLVLDRDVPDAKYGSYMLFNREYATDHILMRDCDFSHCTGRCCFMGNDITVENCRFTGLLKMPLKFQAAYMKEAWAEGHGCTNVVVRGCTFEDCQRFLAPAYAGIVAETFVGRNLRISYEAGSFDLPAYTGIVSGLLFERNRWIRPHAPLALVYCAENVTFRDNEIVPDVRPGVRFAPHAGEVVAKRSRNVVVDGRRLP